MDTSRMVAPDAMHEDMLFCDVSTMIEGARQRAQAAVNTELVMLYWSIGKRLREDELGGKRAEYGQAVVKQLAARLTERHGRGYSRQNLERMMRFAGWLDSTTKCSTLSSILSWSHFTELLVISDEPRREFYAIFAAHERWSVRTLRASIDTKLYERTITARGSVSGLHNELTALRDTGVAASLTFRDPYLLEFLDLPAEHSESDLERAILDDMQHFGAINTNRSPQLANGVHCVQVVHNREVSEMAGTGNTESANAPQMGRTPNDVAGQNQAGSSVGYRLAPQPVLMVAEARANFSRLLSDVEAGPENSVLVGPRGKPSMACVSYTRFEPVLKHGNKAEKLAFLVVEELLPDAPLHLRVPAVRELRDLPLEDLELLLRIDALPLRDTEAKALQQRMRHPEAFERLTKRAHLAQTIADARESGFYEVIADATGEVVDHEGSSK